MGVNNYQTIPRIELNDQMCYSEHHLMVPEHFYCWVAGSFKYFITPCTCLKLYGCAANTSLLSHIKCHVLHILVINNIIVLCSMCKYNVQCVTVLIVLPRFRRTICGNNNNYYNHIMEQGLRSIYICQNRNSS